MLTNTMKTMIYAKEVRRASNSADLFTNGPGDMVINHGLGFVRDEFDCELYEVGRTSASR